MAQKCKVFYTYIISYTCLQKEATRYTGVLGNLLYYSIVSLFYIVLFYPTGVLFCFTFLYFFSFFTSPCRFYLFLFHIFLQGQSFHIRPHPPNPISDYQQGYYLKRLHTRSQSFDNLSYPILIHKHNAYQLSHNIVIDSQ